MLNIEIPLGIIESELRNTATRNLLKSEDGLVKFSLKDNKVEIYGKPVDLETACVLKELTIGNCVHSFSNDWKKANFMFRNEEDLNYGLSCEKV